MRFSSIALLAALASTAVPAATASAQRRSTSELQPGDAVRVWIRDAPTRVGGTVVSNNASMLVLREEATGGESHVMWDGVTRVDQYLGVDRGASAKRGAMLGAFLGLSLGAAFAATHSRECDVVLGRRVNCSKLGMVVVVFGAAGGGVSGALIGTMVGMHRWARVPLAGLQH